MTKILIVVGVAVFIVAVFLALGYGFTLHEINECLRWQEEAKVYPNFYLTDWQKQQCEHHNIPVF